MSEVIDESQFADAEEHVDFLQGYLLYANEELEFLRNKITTLESIIELSREEK